MLVLQIYINLLWINKFSYFPFESNDSIGTIKMILGGTMHLNILSLSLVILLNEISCRLSTLYNTYINIIRINDYVSVIFTHFTLFILMLGAIDIFLKLALLMLTFTLLIFILNLTIFLLTLAFNHLFFYFI